MVRCVSFTDLRIRIPYLPDCEVRIFFLIHYLNVRVCLIRMHTFRHFCEHDKYFMCAMMRVLL